MKTTMALKANLPEFFEKYREIHAKFGRPQSITVETAQGTVTYGEHG